MMHDHRPFDPPQQPVANAAAPLFTLPPLPGARAARLAGRSTAVADLIALRREQAIRFGHTIEADRALPLIHLPKEAEARMRALMDDIRWGKLDQARARALRAAALLLAFADRLDADAAEPPSIL